MVMAMTKANSSRLKPKKRKRIDCPEITTWMRMVEKGEIEACEEQHLLCAYIRDVFATEELIIDYDRIEGYSDYQRYFPFDLFPWEWFCFALFMCVFKANGTPRWSQEFIYVGRGAGKNGYDSFVTFCATTKVNGIKDYDVDICANSEDQARTSFDDIWEILENSGQRAKFANGFSWNKEEITCKSTSSTIKYRTDNPKSKDGLRSGMVIFDEVHAYQNFKNIKVFTTGLGKKPHPRRLYTTTDGDIRDGVLDNLLEKARRILKREMPNNGFLPFICKLDHPDEVHDPTKWPKANPSLPYLPILMDEMLQEYDDFLIDPASNADFMTKRMNLPQGNPDLQVASWDDIKRTSREVPDLRGMSCVCGIDYASTNDFVSAFLLFRLDGMYYGIHHTWICSRSKDLPRIRAPLKEWEQLGIVEFVDDVEVHPSIVCDWVYRQGYDYDIRLVAIDKYRHTLFMLELNEIGFSATEKTVKIVRPSDVMFVQPKINSLFLNGLIVWGDDPAMRWYTNNTKLVYAENSNYKYGKIEPKSRKTDGFSAFVSAMTAEDAIPDYGEIEFLDPIYI